MHFWRDAEHRYTGSEILQTVKKDPDDLSSPGSRNGYRERDHRWTSDNYVPPPYDAAKAGPTPTPDPIEVDVTREGDNPERGHWGSKAEFLLSCVGLSVGIGNVWRFPYLAYDNGGGAFLLPYFILLLLVGKPMYYMEVALGQYSSLKLIPESFKEYTKNCIWGVGFAMVVVSLVVAIYYNVIMGYTLYYIVLSCASDVPWNKCYSWWNPGENCYVRDVNSYNSETWNISKPMADKINAFEIRKINGKRAPGTQRKTFLKQFNADKAEHIFHNAYDRETWNYVLQRNGGIESLGELRWQLAVCLLVSWIIVFLCLMKGVKSSGKVVYFTATFPYLILIILLVRGVTLPGALKGISYFFIPKWEQLLEVKVWKAAAEQLFFSLSVSWGGLIMFGSYNKFRNKVHRDAFFVSSLDFVTSLIAGIVIFSVLGNMSEELGIDIKDVAVGGQGLAFVAYPEALARLPIPQLWSVLFFFMLFTLGLDSEFALLETVLTAIYDEVPKSRNYKVLITGVLCAVCYLIGLPCVTQGGPYVLHLMDTYGGGFAVLFISISELIVLQWIYGVNRFSDNLTFMLGSRPNFYWRACWVFVAPVLLSVIFVYSVVKHQPIKYGDFYSFPDWADGIGWILALVSMVQIPTWAFFVLCQKGFSWKKATASTSSWGPGDPEARRELIQYGQKAFNMAEKSAYDNPAIDTSERF
ncbi:Sodium- and chloride-dependent glycine transporter 2 [Nymphon striatum]|nr:Sodium- and chloride-dependent glycine transporter 2 [Nymphon striatum]